MVCLCRVVLNWLPLHSVRMFLGCMARDLVRGRATPLRQAAPSLAPSNTALQNKAASATHPPVPANCVVTGGSGFVGQRLVEMLVERGAKRVVSFDVCGKPPNAWDDARIECVDARDGARTRERANERARASPAAAAAATNGRPAAPNETTASAPDARRCTWTIRRRVGVIFCRRPEVVASRRPLARTTSDARGRSCDANGLVDDARRRRSCVKWPRPLQVRARRPARC